jgi:hypothetical protein
MPGACAIIRVVKRRGKVPEADTRAIGPKEEKTMPAVYTVVSIRTHEMNEAGELAPRASWRDFGDALQRMQAPGTAEADVPEVPELLCYKQGWALFTVDAEWGRRALADAMLAGDSDRVGIAVPANAVFDEYRVEEAIRLRAQYLRAAGVNPYAYALTRPQRWGAWTVFPLR